MEEVVHHSGRFFGPVLQPPAKEGEETSSQGRGAGVQFSLRNGREALGEREAPGNSAREMALGEIKKIVEAAGVGEGAVDLDLGGNVGEHLAYRNHTVGGVLAINEAGAHGFQERFKLGEEQVGFVAEVEVEGGSADGGAIKDFLDGDFIERFVAHQLDQGHAEALAAAEDTFVGFALVPGRGLRRGRSRRLGGVGWQGAG